MYVCMYVAIYKHELLNVNTSPSKLNLGYIYRVAKYCHAYYANAYDKVSTCRQLKYMK